MSVSMDVVLTTHNDSEFLREAILSIVCGAEGADLLKRIVIVDDASRPAEAAHAAALVEELKTYHQDIVLIRNTANCGLSHSRNRGLRFCSADYVTFLDADDIKPVGWGVIVRKLIEEHDPEYLFTASALIDDRYTFSPFYDEDYFRRLFKGDVIKEFTGHTRFLPLVLEPQIGNKYFKLETVNQYLFPIGRKYEDLYMIARMTVDLDRVVGANVVTHLYNTTERSTRVTMTPKLKGDIVGNLSGLLSIYGHYFEKHHDALIRRRGQEGAIADRELDRQLRTLDIERQFAFAALKCAFGRMIEWSINTVGIGDVDEFADRVGRVFRQMSCNPPVAEVLGDVARRKTLERFDDLVNALIRGDRGHLGQIYA
jgi:glycosyltransferase involved in cell wall biosynthesis